MTRPKFVPKKGQIDYTNARWAPVINCIVKFKDKFIIVQRNKDLHFYPGYWNGISGFLDDNKTLEQKVQEELREELGLSKDKIKKIQLGHVFDQDDPDYKKVWITHPVLVTVLTDKIRLDWEARNYQWITLKEVKKFKTLRNFDLVLKNLSHLL